MGLNIHYGDNLESVFLQAGETIAKDVEKGKYFEVSKKINQSFFGGGQFAPKSMKTLASVNIPDYHIRVVDCTKKKCPVYAYVKIRKKISLSAVLGWVEGIPLIGSAIAIFKSFYHIYHSISYGLELKNLVKKLNDEKKKENHPANKSEMIFHLTVKIFSAANQFTVNQNQLGASFLSIIPLVKPIARILQTASFHKSV